MAMCKEWRMKGSLGKFWNVAHLEDEETKDLKIRGCWRLQQNVGEGNWRLGGVEKENQTLGTERCENIKNLYINK